MASPPRVSICIPLLDRVHSDFMLSFIGVLSENLPKYDLRLVFSKRFPLDAARNELVEKALLDDPDYLWFIDSDMIIPPGALDALIKSDKDIVSALYYQRKPPFRPVVCMMKDGKYRMLDMVKLNSIFEVDIVGFGCVLVRKGVVEKMKSSNHGIYFDFKNKGGDVTEQLNEDMVFCENARKLGFKVFLDSRVICKHIGEIYVDENLSHLLLQERMKNQPGEFSSVDK